MATLPDLNFDDDLPELQFDEPDASLPELNFGSDEALPDLAFDDAPAEQPKGWGLMDDIKTGVRSTLEAVGNTLPIVNQMILTDTELAPAPSTAAKVADFGADMVSGIGTGALGFAAGGPVGMGVLGAADQLGRNAEDKRIADVRAAEAADPTISKYDADFEARQNLDLDAGDYADAAVAGGLNLVGGKLGEAVFKSGLGRLGGLSTLTAADAATGALQGVSSTLNRENATPEEAAEILTSPEMAGQVLRDGAISGALSAGGQAVRGLGLSPLFGKGETDGLQSGEIQRQTPSGSVALEPTTAREAVINSRGEQVEMPGRPALSLDAQPKADRADILGKVGTTNPDLVEGLQARGALARDAETGELPKRIESINIKRFAGEDDKALQDLIAGSALTNEEALAAQKAVTGDLLSRASRVDKWKDPKAVERLKPNQALNDEEGIALDNYTMGKVAEFRDNPTPENLEMMEKYLKASAGVSSAAGRALGARNLYRKAVFDKLPDWERAMVNTRDMFSGAGKEMPRSAIKRLAEVKDKDNPKEVIEALMDIKQKHDGVLGQIGSYRYFNMLSSPMTHALNTVSNATSLAGEVAARPIMSIGDKIAAGDSVMAKGETLAGLKAAGTWGFKDAAHKAVWVLKNGYRVEDVAAMDPAKMHVEMVGRGLNPANYVNRLLFATDEMFKGVSDAFYRTALSHRKVTKLADEQGLIGKERQKFMADMINNHIDGGDKEIDDAAKAFAKYMVHQEEPWISIPKATKNMPPDVQTAINQATNHIMPFVNVVQNVLKKGVVASGGGFLAPITRGMTREQRLRNVAQATIGVSGAMALLPHAMEGNITGDAPSDPLEREKFYESGKKPFHLYIGDTALDYRMLGPYAMPLMHLANYVEATKAKEADPNSSIATSMALGVARSFAQLPVLAGIGSFVEAINDPERRGQAFVANIASQYIPASSMQRFANSSGLAGTAVGEAHTIPERIQSGTIADQGFKPLGIAPLPNRVNSFGKEVKRQGLFTDRTKDEVYLELDRLGVNPPGRPTRAKIDGETRNLTADERRAIQKAGAPAYDEALYLVQSPEYKALTDAEKKEELERVIKRTSERERKPAYKSLGGLGLAQ